MTSKLIKLSGILVNLAGASLMESLFKPGSIHEYHNIENYLSGIKNYNLWKYRKSKLITELKNAN